MEKLYTDFIFKLRKLYGKFDEDQKRFEKVSNSEVARELGYSDAQFSRLINESATVGEYHRAIQNVERILTVIHLEAELKKGGGKTAGWKNNPFWLISVVLMVFIICFFIFEEVFLPKDNRPAALDLPRDYTVQWAFETSFINPYTNLDDLPADCNYPSYKYQGKWKLKQQYKIPLFRERNGYHYLATEVIMYAHSMNSNGKGNLLEGYEYQHHEIWYDKRKWPIDSFIVDNSNLKDFYQDLNFSKDPNFVKVATVHTFFRNEFRIDSNKIYRRGKVIGRDIEFTSRELLEENFAGSEIIGEIENSLDRITRNLLEDFSKPVFCGVADVPAKDFHDIRDGDTMSFDCELTTHRFSMGYTKTYVLTDQYIKNDCRSLK